jgi:hypothetical protein
VSDVSRWPIDCPHPRCDTTIVSVRAFCVHAQDHHGIHLSVFGLLSTQDDRTVRATWAVPTAKWRSDERAISECQNNHLCFVRSKGRTCEQSFADEKSLILHFDTHTDIRMEHCLWINSFPVHDGTIQTLLSRDETPYSIMKQTKDTCDLSNLDLRYQRSSNFLAAQPDDPSSSLTWVAVQCSTVQKPTASDRVSMALKCPEHDCSEWFPGHTELTAHIASHTLQRKLEDGATLFVIPPRRTPKQSSRLPDQVQVAPKVILRPKVRGPSKPCARRPGRLALSCPCPITFSSYPPFAKHFLAEHSVPSGRQDTLE